MPCSRINQAITNERVLVIPSINRTREAPLQRSSYAVIKRSLSQSLNRRSIERGLRTAFTLDSINPSRDSARNAADQESEDRGHGKTDRRNVRRSMYGDVRRGMSVPSKPSNYGSPCTFPRGIGGI